MQTIPILSPRMAYLATGRTKEDDNEVFSSVDNSQADKQRKHSSAISSYCAQRSARRRFHAANSLNVERDAKSSTTRDDSNSQRPTQFRALSDD